MVVVAVIDAAGALPLPRRGARLLPRRGSRGAARLPELVDALEGLLPRTVHHVKDLAGGAHLSAAAAPRAHRRPYLVSHAPIMLFFRSLLIAQLGTEPGGCDAAARLASR